MVLLLIFSVLLALVAAFFALQNAVPVTVMFFGHPFEGSLAVIILATLASGILITLLILLPLLIKRNITIAGLKRKIKHGSFKFGSQGSDNSGF